MARQGSPAGQGLTAREEQVAKLMAAGRTNAEIAQALGISFNTAKWHVSQVIGKLGVTSREEAVACWQHKDSPSRRLHRILAGMSFAATLKATGALVLAAGSIGVAVFVAETTAGSAGNPIVPAIAPTPAVVFGTPTPTPPAPEGCPGGPDTYTLPLDPCPPEYFSTLQGAYVNGVCDLSGRGIGGNLFNADLRNCNLTGANLAGSAANNAHFDGANLSGATFRGGSFANSSFEGANLAGAELAPAIFQGANVRNANLEGAIIRDAHFGGARWGNTTCPDGTNSDDPANRGSCVGTGGIVVVPYVFGGATAARDPETPSLATDLRELDNGACNFDGLDVTGVSLWRLNLPGCSFAGSDLSGVEIRGSSLGGANLAGARIEGTVFSSVDLTDASLRDATGIPAFSYVKWANTICPDGTNSDASDGDNQTCESNLLPSGAGPTGAQ